MIYEKIMDLPEDAKLTKYDVADLFYVHKNTVEYWIQNRKLKQDSIKCKVNYHKFSTKQQLLDYYYSWGKKYDS